MDNEGTLSAIVPSCSSSSSAPVGPVSDLLDGECAMEAQSTWRNFRKHNTVLYKHEVRYILNTLCLMAAEAVENARLVQGK